MSDSEGETERIIVRKANGDFFEYDPKNISDPGRRIYMEDLPAGMPGINAPGIELTNTIIDVPSFTKGTDGREWNGRTTPDPDIDAVVKQIVPGPSQSDDYPETLPGMLQGDGRPVILAMMMSDTARRRKINEKEELRTALNPSGIGSIVDVEYSDECVLRPVIPPSTPQTPAWLRNHDQMIAGLKALGIMK